MRIAHVLAKYTLRDLLPFAISELVNWLDCMFSTTAFRIRAWFHLVKLGHRPLVWGPVLFHRFPGSQIIVGDNVRIISRPRRYAQNIYQQAKLRTMQSSAQIVIGNNVGFNSISILARSQLVTIGDNTLIGGNCQIMDTDGHPLWPPSQRSYYPGAEHDAPVRIGRNVFIGLNVIILKGSEIGDNSVIGAGSVVSGVIPANCIAAGVPAKVVRYFPGDSD